jgi:hypothetical protein
MINQYQKSYHDALAAAITLARIMGREVGIEKFRDGRGAREGYVVRNLPKAENRTGWELRCEVVRPDDPMPEIGGAS